MYVALLDGRTLTTNYCEWSIREINHASYCKQCSVLTKKKPRESSLDMNTNVLPFHRDRNKFNGELTKTPPFCVLSTLTGGRWTKCFQHS